MPPSVPIPASSSTSRRDGAHEPIGRIAADQLRIAEDACSAEIVDGREVSRINALRPTKYRPQIPADAPPDIAEAMRRARNGDRASEQACATFAAWRFSVLQLEQDEAQKVETLFWLWRTFLSSPDPVHVSAAVPLVRMVLKNAWGIALTEHPPDFATARKIASVTTRRIEDLPAAWRAL